MSAKKKAIREAFRKAVFERDGYCCMVCGIPQEEIVFGKLDAHHITDRAKIVNGGYVKENGISLCPKCHLLAEEFHSTGISAESMSPEDLYEMIGSSLEKAIKASERLK